MKITIIGAFDFVDMDTGGQPVKTRGLYYALQKKYGVDAVSYVETMNWKRKPLNLFLELYKKVKKSDIVVMLPAHNGVLIFSQLLLAIKKNRTKLYYDVVGGWLPDKVKKHNKLKKMLQKFTGIWVETSSMKKDLVDLGFDNVSVIPNFKNLSILKESDLCKKYHNPIRLCTFSRVIPEKGIEDAVEVVNRINCMKSETVFLLDIYGPIPAYYEKEFNEILHLSSAVKYKGVVSPEESVETLKDYDYLLFPTRFYTEGIPGTIIDAYSAGVPVITSIWKNASDVFQEEVTGYGYEMGKVDELLRILINILDNPSEFSKMKKHCIEWAYKFSEQSVIQMITQIIDA